MTTPNPNLSTLSKPVHPWLKRIKVSLVPGPLNPLTESVIANILDQFVKFGHEIQDQPNDETDLILTAAPYGEPISWRESLLFTCRRRFGLQALPTIITMVHLVPQEFERLLAEFEKSLSKEVPDPGDFEFPGLAPGAYRVLHEQGRRGGPILALERLIQAQTKSIRNLLLIGKDTPERIYHFDLVGAHPFTLMTDYDSFFTDIVLRIVTTLSTTEITAHQHVDPPVSAGLWKQLSTPEAMINGARKFGERNFFTEMVTIANLVQVPAVSDVVASQYSEGCFATWDPVIDGLLTTVTGSARPVHKGSITEQDLAIIVGIRPDGQGALVRHVEGRENDPPSTEAVEMYGMDANLPAIALDSEWNIQRKVPVMRSKLHGHRGISSYDPELVEHIPLAPPYYHYPVSCATEAQANGIIEAFSRAEALQNLDDPRQVVFTILPGHGVMIVEKWVVGKAPFQVIWELMDAGKLNVENHIPQGMVHYAPGVDNMFHLQR